MIHFHEVEEQPHWPF